MIYFIYGHQLPVIRKTLKNLIRECLNGEEQNDFNVEKFSARITLIQDIVFSMMSCSIMSDHKIVVVTEPYFLSSEKEKVSFEKEQDYESLIRYLENPSPNTDVIFFLEAKEINVKSEIYKLIKKNGKVMPQEILTEEMLKGMGMAIFTKKGVQISKDALEELVSRCGYDVSKFTSEATKLSLYKNEINIDDVKLMVCAKLEDNAFLIADSLLKNKISQALKIYYDLRINKEEPVRLISLIATQFRFMMQVQFLMAKNYSYDEIANELKTKPFRVKKNGESLILIKRSGLLNIMEYLYQMDMQIKSGEKDPYIIFELFIINFNQIKNGEIKLKD